MDARDGRWKVIAQHLMWSEISRRIAEAVKAGHLPAQPTNALVHGAVARAYVEAEQHQATFSPIQIAEFLILRVVAILVESHANAASAIDYRWPPDPAAAARREALFKKMQEHKEAQQHVLWEAKPLGEGVLGYLDGWTHVQHWIMADRAKANLMDGKIPEVPPETPRCVTKTPAAICDCGRFMLSKVEA